MASVARCSTEGCHDYAAQLCPQCLEPVCRFHSTETEVCFECVLGMNATQQPEQPESGVEDFDPSIIWQMEEA